MMQRLRLHLKGVEVPKLGTMRDRVLRAALNEEDRLELKKLEFQMMIAATNPSYPKAEDQREWVDRVKKVWKGLVGLTMHVKIPEHSDEENRMLEYYDKVVSKLRPKIQLTKKEGSNRKTLAVTGLSRLM